MIDISKLSKQYDVRALDDSDTDMILDVYKENDLFFQYCEAEPTRQQVIEDMHITPPGKDLASKYFIGFYQDTELVAVLDLIDGYPEPEIAYIGMFMMNIRRQGKQIGSAIISEVERYLKETGRKAVRLAINKGNPQSTHFWKKNGYIVFREVNKDGWGILLEAEKVLSCCSGRSLKIDGYHAKKYTDQNVFLRET